LFDFFANGDDISFLALEFEDDVEVKFEFVVVVVAAAVGVVGVVTVVVVVVVVGVDDADDDDEIDAFEFGIVNGGNNGGGGGNNDVEGKLFTADVRKNDERLLLSDLDNLSTAEELFVGGEKIFKVCSCV